jgi:hypothetical protein
MANDKIPTQPTHELTWSVVTCLDCRYGIFSDCYRECINPSGLNRIVGPWEYCSRGERYDNS